MTKEKLYEIVDANVVGGEWLATKRTDTIMQAFDEYLTNHTNENLLESDTITPGCSEWDIVEVYSSNFGITSTNIDKLSDTQNCIYNRYYEDNKSNEIHVINIKDRIDELKDELKEISQRLEDLLNE